MVRTMEVLLIMAIIISSACTTHKADIRMLELKKGSIFEVAIVEVEGRLPYPKALMPEANDVEKKAAALQKIQIDEISDILSSEYGLQIDRNVNKTIRNIDGIKEQIIYLGNRDYVSCFDLKKILLEEIYYCIKNENVGDYIWIIYGFTILHGAPWKLKNRIYYQVLVKSDGNVLLRHSGNIAVIDLGLSYSPKNIDNNLARMKLAWDELIRHADQVDEALSRDIAKTKAKTSD